LAHNNDREVRYEALQVAQKRFQAALSRSASGDPAASHSEFAAAPAKAGL
jgi:hypothetical protein